MEREVQAFLVTSANRRISKIIEEFSQKEYGNKEYADEINKLINANVIEIPNPQIWVEDEYFTNSTKFSLTHMAKFPWSYSARPTSYSIPVDNPHFGEKVMDSKKDVIFYDRALAEWTNMFHKLFRYYPTHTIEVPDFSHALLTFWAKSNWELLDKVEEHHKRFFTHKLINQFISSLLYKENENIEPNVTFVFYDVIGLQTQSMLWNLDRFEERFMPPASFITGCDYGTYQGLWKDFISPLRSLAAMGSGVKVPHVDFRHTTDIPDDRFREMQSLISIFNKVNTKRFSVMFKNILKGDSLEEVLKELDELNTTTPRHTKKALKNKKENEETEYTQEFVLEDKNISVMERRGCTFSSYNYSIDLLPDCKIFSEVIINMEKFYQLFPAATEKQFIDVYNMAQAVNAARRSFATKYTDRNDWQLLVRIKDGHIANTSRAKDGIIKMTCIDEVTDKLRSDNMDNYTVRFE